MKTIARTVLGTAAAAAVAVSAAAPAVARDHGGIDAGDVIAGALIIGGIAAVAAAADNDRYDRYDGRYAYDDRYDGRGWGGYGRYDDRRGGRWNDRGSPRAAVEQCVRAAERTAARYSYGRADVTDIRDVRNTSRGYEVRGRIAVNANGRDWRDGDRIYGRGWNNDYRGWNNSLRGYDSGSFRCRVEYGRVADIDYSGIRGL